MHTLPKLDLIRQPTQEWFTGTGPYPFRLAQCEGSEEKCGAQIRDAFDNQGSLSGIPSLSAPNPPQWDREFLCFSKGDTFFLTVAQILTNLLQRKAFDVQIGVAVATVALEQFGKGQKAVQLDSFVVGARHAQSTALFPDRELSMT